jgi:hypothetical protein
MEETEDRMGRGKLSFDRLSPTVGDQVLAPSRL